MTSQSCKTADEHSKMGFKAKLSSETRAYVRFGKEWKRFSVKQIIQQSHISRASLYCSLKQGKIRENNQERQKKKTIGQPPKLGARKKSNYFYENCQNWGNQKENLLWSDLCSKQASVQDMFPSVYNVFFIAKDTGIYKHAKRVCLTDKDLKKRLKFARKIKREYDDSLWTEQIAFFLDAVSFIHKFNPADQARAPWGRIWRKETEGLGLWMHSKGFSLRVWWESGKVCCGHNIPPRSGSVGEIRWNERVIF